MEAKKEVEKEFENEEDQGESVKLRDNFFKNAVTLFVIVYLEHPADYNATHTK